MDRRLKIVSLEWSVSDIEVDNTVNDVNEVQILSVGLIGFVDLFLGCFTIFSAVFLAQLQDPNSSLKVNTNEASWIASISHLISPLGHLIIGILTDKIGRRNTLHVAYIMIILSWAIFAFCESYEAILVGRVFQGIACGANTLTYMYVGEICLARQRPLFVSLVTLLVGVGMTGQCVLAVYFHWHTMSVVLLAVSVFGCASLFLVPESPRWLRAKGRVSEAEAAEEWFGTGGNDAAQTELGRPAAAAVVLQPDETTAATNVPAAVATRWSVYTHRTVWLPTLVMMGFFTCLHLSGLYVLLSYSAYVLRDFRVRWDGITVTAVFSVARVTGSLAFSLLHGVKRRTLMATSGVGMATSLVVIVASKRLFPYGDSVNVVPVTALVAYVFFSMIGLMPLAWIYCSEVFPTAVKGTMNGFVLTYNSLISFMIIKLYPMLVFNLGIEIVWSMFAIVCVSSAFYGIFILPETKGKTLDEVLMSFESHKKTTNSNHNSVEKKL